VHRDVCSACSSKKPFLRGVFGLTQLLGEVRLLCAVQNLQVGISTLFLLLLLLPHTPTHLVFTHTTPPLHPLFSATALSVCQCQQQQGSTTITTITTTTTTTTTTQPACVVRTPDPDRVWSRYVVFLFELYRMFIPTCPKHQAESGKLLENRPQRLIGGPWWVIP
jgi:hypothetical protein